MSVKLKAYVACVATVGVGLLLGLATTIELPRSPRELLTMACSPPASSPASCCWSASATAA